MKDRCIFREGKVVGSDSWHHKALNETGKQLKLLANHKLKKLVHL